MLRLKLLELLRTGLLLSIKASLIGVSSPLFKHHCCENSRISERRLQRRLDTCHFLWPLCRSERVYLTFTRVQASCAPSPKSRKRRALEVASLSEASQGICSFIQMAMEKQVSSPLSGACATFEKGCCSSRRGQIYIYICIHR